MTFTHLGLAVGAGFVTVFALLAIILWCRCYHKSSSSSGKSAIRNGSQQHFVTVRGTTELAGGWARSPGSGSSDQPARRVSHSSRKRSAHSVASVAHSWGEKDSYLHGVGLLPLSRRDQSQEQETKSLKKKVTRNRTTDLSGYGLPAGYASTHGHGSGRRMTCAERSSHFSFKHAIAFYENSSKQSQTQNKIHRRGTLPQDFDSAADSKHSDPAQSTIRTHVLPANYVEFQSMHDLAKFAAPANNQIADHPAKRLLHDVQIAPSALYSPPKFALPANSIPKHSKLKHPREAFEPCYTPPAHQDTARRPSSSPGHYSKKPTWHHIHPDVVSYSQAFDKKIFFQSCLM